MAKMTMADVAREAGVSKSTVSQYLNGRYEYMSSNTKDKIAAAIQALDYRPNVLARSLKQKRTFTIGVIVANMLHQFSLEICRGIESYCREQGISVILCNTDEDEAREREDLELLRSKQVDGVIAFPSGQLTPLYQKLVQEGFPLVFVDRKLEGVQVSRVVVDNEQAAYKATEHLIHTGHQHIAMLTAPLSISTRVERVHGYTRAMEELLPQITPMILSDEVKQLRHTLSTWAQQQQLPTAIIAGNDLVLLEVLAFLKEYQLQIPQDMALIVFDNIPFAELLTPTLSTIVQPSHDMGRQAAEMLLASISAQSTQQEQPAIQEKQFTCTLMIRESSAQSMNIQ
ncbi:LacI family kdg operon repressor [Paenibacillus sp. SORGH_AS306]|uniref:LacI family DNA-binding transcriptional regulator n=2 Tax=unclassified Paenibacillus TaxID=185978 RepID=UPI00277F9578|nr:LacI family DNA-binding transcriptional regulator [Paenibacillus sp. SORGH_AS_0306]MDQ1232543.1 LacI family kdg operon repressor [Paenibacillus sp. SORGH_AS_0306]